LYVIGGLYKKRWQTVAGNALESLKVKKVKVKQSRYTPWRRLGGEEV
jgi:hypothetical protein